MNSDGKYTRRRLNLEIPIVILIAGLILAFVVRSSMSLG